jgi:D-alanyl-D-alanine carboxypeptidase
VGAHKSKPDAERHLTDVRAKTATLLTGLNGQVVEARTANGTIHRARFFGADASRAAAVCTELRRLAIDCLVTSQD